MAIFNSFLYVYQAGYIPMIPVGLIYQFGLNQGAHGSAVPTLMTLAVMQAWSERLAKVHTKWGPLDS